MRVKEIMKENVKDSRLFLSKFTTVTDTEKLMKAARKAGYALFM